MAITGLDIHEMVRHWLKTPINSYHGSNYGCDPKALLQNPQSIGVADAFLKKLVKDVPILQALPANAVNIYAVPNNVDKLDIFVDVSGTALQVTGHN
jgi:hypothetical protein